MTPEQGATALSILLARNGRLTLVTLSENRESQVLNVAWGRDFGADFDHVTTNISPAVRGLSVDFFHTSEIVKLCDENGGDLFVG